MFTFNVVLIYHSRISNKFLECKKSLSPNSERNTGVEGRVLRPRPALPHLLAPSRKPRAFQDPIPHLQSWGRKEVHTCIPIWHPEHDQRDMRAPCDVTGKHPLSHLFTINAHYHLDHDLHKSFHTNLIKSL